MEIKVGKQYRVIGTGTHHFPDGVTVELVRDGFVMAEGKEGEVGHFIVVNDPTFPKWYDQVLRYGIDVEEIN